jgi:hypothetical protein
VGAFKAGPFIFVTSLKLIAFVVVLPIMLTIYSLGHARCFYQCVDGRMALAILLFADRVPIESKYSKMR